MTAKGIRRVPIPALAGYMIDTRGTVYSAWVKQKIKGFGNQRAGWRYIIGPTWRRMTPTPDAAGYPTVKLRTAGCRNKTYRVHSLVLMAFVGARPRGMEACHRDDNKANCRLTNLRYDTRKRNAADAIRNGRTSRGERQAKAKLTEADVRAIHERFGRGDPVKRIAADFGVSESHTYSIARGRFWGWLNNRPRHERCRSKGR